MRSLDEITLDDNDRQRVEAAARVLRERFPVEQVILYGSKARGDARPDSDLDLLVLTSRKLDWRTRTDMTMATVPLWLDGGAPIELLVVASDEWYRGVSQALPIRAEIDREGVEVP